MNKNILENYKWTPDPRWDNKVLTYNKDKFNWAGELLEIVRELCPQIDSLENIHLYFKPPDLPALRQHLERWTNSREFSQQLDAFFQENISPIVDCDDYLIQKTSGIRLVVPDQEHLGRLLSFHTGYWTGYSNDMFTVWTPLSRTFGTNTMQVLSWQDSAELMERIHTEKLSLDQIQHECIKHMRPVEIEVGQSWLFNQGHLHGNVNNDTGISRVSFDARCALPQGDFGPRRVGGFFRLQGTHAEIDARQIQPGPWIVFIDQNSEYIGNIPHYIVREFLMQTTKTLGIVVNEWSNEYWGCTWMPKLHDFVNRPNLKGLVMPSIHAFSGNVDLRMSMFKSAVNNGQQLLFVDEQILVTTLSDLILLEKLYSVEH